MLGSLLSLGVTVATKYLIDGATSTNVRALWVYGGALVALISAGRKAGAE